MSAPTTKGSARGVARTVGTTVFAALIAAGLVSAANHLGLTGHDQDLDAQRRTLIELSTQFEEFKANTDELKQQVSGLRSEFQNLTERLDGRIDQVAQETKAAHSIGQRALDEANTLAEQQASIAALSARVAELDRRAKAAPARTATRSAPRPAAQAPTPTLPPFDVVGAELRANQLYLSVLPRGALSVGEAVFMQEHDTYQGWRLKKIGTQAAVFAADGRDVSITIGGR